MLIPTIAFLSSIRCAAVGWVDWVSRYSLSLDATMESTRWAAATSSEGALTLVALTPLLSAWTTMSKCWSTASGAGAGDPPAIKLVAIKRKKRGNKACT